MELRSEANSGTDESIGHIQTNIPRNYIDIGSCQPFRENHLSDYDENYVSGGVLIWFIFTYD
jgi:hypothetical protein